MLPRRQRPAPSGREAEAVIRYTGIGIGRRDLSRTPNPGSGKLRPWSASPGGTWQIIRLPMPAHDSTHCREQLATLMADQNARLAELEGLLTQEYALLQTSDAEGLEKAGTARQQCIGDILRIEDERRALCRATGRSEDAAGFHHLLAWCDPTGLLVAAMHEYRERTRRCREQNDRNGILVNGRLHAGIQEGRTYGPGGDSSRGYGRKLTTRA